MPNGHLVEMQLHLKAILDVKNGPGHKLYEQIRAIEARAKVEHRDLTPAESRQIADLKDESQELYDNAYEESQRE
jgi:hypothetical protein